MSESSRAKPISGEECTDPTEQDRVVEPLGDDKYNIRDGKLVVLREPVGGLTRAREAARSGLMDQPENKRARVLLLTNDGLEHYQGGSPSASDRAGCVVGQRDHRSA